MTDIFATVTDVETKVVETVRKLQEPVVAYVRKGVAYADDKLPTFEYPGSFPSPSKVIDSQVDFLKSLLDAQRDVAQAVVRTVKPLVDRSPADTPVAPKAPKAPKSTKA